MEHADKVEAAKAAIEEVFGDTSVSQRQTRDSLEEIAGRIDVMLDTLNDNEEF